MEVRSSTQRRWFRTHVETVLATMLDEAPAPDGDGDYPIRGVTSQGWVRLQTGAPCGVQVFVCAARDVPAKVAVLREINDANTTSVGTRVLLGPGGFVIVDCFVFADAVTEETLRTVVGRVLHLADTLGPVLTAVHGGSTIHPATSSRAA